MNAARRWLVFVVVCVSAAPLSGCMRAAKQGISEILGAQGEAVWLVDLDAAAVAQCNSVRFDPVTTTLTERICPRRLLDAYDQAYAERMGELEEAGFSGGEPALRVSTDVLYFEEKGLLGEALLLSRVRLREASGLAGDLIVKTVSESFREAGADALAEESAKVVRRALVKARGSE
ncbi:MAG: hypothetical protein D6744_16680 [Planctomycetota bacterium]|nr:MAG: hypothetical protein D6744_16680 [Planctomycetota bacterium]